MPRQPAVGLQAAGFIATGERVRLDSHLLSGHAVTAAARAFSVTNRLLASVSKSAL